MLEAYLYYIVTMSTSSGTPVINRIKMESTEVCNEAVKAARIAIPQGGDAETTVTIFCGGPDIKRKVGYTDGSERWN